MLDVEEHHGSCLCVGVGISTSWHIFWDASSFQSVCACPRRSRAWGHFPGKVRGVWVVRDILPCTFCFGLACFAFNLFQPGGVGERSTAALEKAACFQSRSRLRCTRAGQKNALYIFSRVWGKETQPCWNKPHFFKAVAGFTVARSEAGYGFRKKRLYFSRVVWGKEAPPR